MTESPLSNIVDRFRKLIHANIDSSHRWAMLEAQTGIPATSWQKAFTLKQRPTAEMLEAIARIWPTNAFWLITGLTDAKHGHVACAVGTADSFFPERQYATRKAAQQYFEHACNMYLRVYKDGRVPSEEREADDERRLLLLETWRDAEEVALGKAEERDLADRLELADRRLARLKEATARPADIEQIQPSATSTNKKKSGAKAKK